MDNLLEKLKVELEDEKYLFCLDDNIKHQLTPDVIEVIMLSLLGAYLASVIGLEKAGQKTREFIKIVFKAATNNEISNPEHIWITDEVEKQIENLKTRHSIMEHNRACNEIILMLKDEGIEENVAKIIAEKLMLTVSSE